MNETPSWGGTLPNSCTSTIPEHEKVTNRDWAGTNRARGASGVPASRYWRGDRLPGLKLLRGLPTAPARRRRRDAWSSHVPTASAHCRSPTRWHPHVCQTSTPPVGTNTRQPHSNTPPLRDFASRWPPSRLAFTFTWLGVRKTLAPKQRLVPRIRAYLDVIQQVVRRRFLPVQKLLGKVVGAGVATQESHAEPHALFPRNWHNRDTSAT